MWHRLDHEADLFLGEACVPLVHLMDLEPHRGWYALTDPQGKRPRAGGGGGGGGGGAAPLEGESADCFPEVFLELQYLQGQDY